ncbi:MAG: ShlB/FhaC/HecB family hemolysin secretion/activation protein [Symploca sp. SIO2E9]|nr:ShlB/FhaC/HecB family hemolysin secretion/activation protein [Symploca sp. SIO2E9]
MGLLWSEFLIQGSLSKRLPGELSPLCVGVACSFATGAVFSHGPIAAVAQEPSVALQQFGQYSLETPTQGLKLLSNYSYQFPVEGIRELQEINYPIYLSTEGSNLASSTPPAIPFYPGERNFAWDLNSPRLGVWASGRLLTPCPTLFFVHPFYPIGLEHPELSAQNFPITPGTSQPNPNEDRFPQPPPKLEPLPPDNQPPVQVPPTPEPQTVPDSQAILVEKIEVTGSSVFSQEQFEEITAPFEGSYLTLEQLTEVADAITQLYLEKGFITSRAILVDQEIKDGIVEIRVLEGSIEDIRIEGARRLENYVRRRVLLGARTPLNTAKLEDQLRLLRIDPLFENIEASLRAGSRIGESVIIVRVTEANPFEGSLGVDNYSTPSIGSERLSSELRYRNLTGNGDELFASYERSTTGGSNVFEGSYRLPLNPKNGTLQLRTILNRSEVTQEPFRGLFEGNSELYEISWRQPLVRTTRQEFALSLGFSFQENQSILNFDGGGSLSPGADSEGITRTSIIKFGQDYLRRDLRGAWSARSLFSLGTGWFGATVNADPEPDGRFLSWLGQLQRVQLLGEDNFLIVGADIQLTTNSLLPSQQFLIGGGQSLRGYRQNVRGRDNGLRFSVEDRIILERNEIGDTTLQLAPFFDAGYVWNNPDNPSNDSLRQVQSERFLAGLGMGLIWQVQPQMEIRLDYGIPLVDIDDRGDNIQDDGLYFTVRYRF